ncbi:uncharacterized protein FFUJ_09025 [Fusarium fujikuroi IMI 58289]|uniref:Uncharacterized protein n=1 Tax=Gibberella fujikuroi (strain CBS 195.34 / IMI 58289 / NRRL A-6831) TaxID=1279085 RepID=S0EEZ7_GIBF5|nr:uncharacterized protein FFUJ_09025 [Fusarium fujikuroi IMI 58289]KLP17791.1 uncharacterized protein LW94_12577 [Fusarium fujikuroi]QGI83905.1 hypothetical protein CEK25_010634 [Fusarium fujikuroi]CCT70948.1 uncharacterized protein FFUJ_09025 [Fusarium fujikuroi IMI 58289]SCO02619.1 uncharacterized protein FFM5_07907 [Fusarium fujikuroi]SCO52986.1 uncharacterized protein FFMR_11305 [Fusarium fujikuroi]
MDQDIRTKYQLTGPDAAIVAQILECRHQQVKGTGQPGFDCLIVVIRRIYSHVMLALGGCPDWLKASEDRNPILRLAWRLFEDGTERQDLAARAAVLAELDSKGLPVRIGFEQLCTSSLMNETLWSQDELRLTDILYCMESREEAEGSRDDIASDSLLDLDHVVSPGSILQEVVNASFGPVTKGDKQVMSRPNSPWIVRVLYQPDRDTSQSLDINGLRSILLPIWDRDVDQPDDTFRTVGYNEYSILAVVRLKRGDTSQEYVRTYKEHGANIVSQREPDSFVNNQWSIKEPGRYMLFYGLKTLDYGGDPTSFPEVEEPPISESNNQLLQDVGMFLKSFDSTKKQQTVPSSKESSKATPKRQSPAPEASEAVGNTREGPSDSPDLGTGGPDPDTVTEETPSGSNPRKRAPQISEEELLRREGPKPYFSRKGRGNRSDRGRQNNARSGGRQGQGKLDSSKAPQVPRDEQSRDARRE